MTDLQSCVSPLPLISVGTCLLSRVRLCEPMDGSPPGSSVHGILQAKILEWVAISSSKGSPNPGTEPTSPELAGGLFTTKPPGKPPS